MAKDLNATRLQNITKECKNTQKKPFDGCQLLLEENLQENSKDLFKIMTSCYALGHYFKKASELRHYQISALYPDVSLSVSMHVKEDAKEKKGLASSCFTFPLSLALRHQSLACH